MSTEVEGIMPAINTLKPFSQFGFECALHHFSYDADWADAIGEQTTYVCALKRRIDMESI